MSIGSKVIVPWFSEAKTRTLLQNVISSTGKSLVFPLIYFHVNEQWTAKPIRHTRQPISSASYKHERTADQEE